MSFLRRTAGLCFSALVLCCFPGEASAQQAVGRSGAFPNPARVGQMRVLEAAPPAVASATYTIVGAVNQSGAYISAEQTLPISKLVNAAGGLIPEALPALRIIRKNEFRFQVSYQPQGAGPDHMLLPGDIVVVPTRPSDPARPVSSASLVPVACVGLIDRPVVLPLDPTINTVEELTRRLLQHPAAAASAQIIDPARSTLSSNQLTAGSVIIFDAQRIDRLPFQLPDALPPALDLEPIQTPAGPGVALPPHTVFPPLVPGARLVQQTVGEAPSAPQKEAMVAPPLTLPVASEPSVVIERPAVPAPELPIIQGAPSRETSTTFRPEQSTSMPASVAQAIELFAPQSPASSAATSQAAAPVRAESARQFTLDPTPYQSTRPVIQHAIGSGETNKNPAETITRTAGVVTGPERTSSSRLHSQDTTRSDRSKSLTTPGTQRNSKVFEYFLIFAASTSILSGAGLLYSVVVHPADSAPSPASAPQPAPIAETPALEGTQPTASAPVEAQKTPVAAKSSGSRQGVLNELLNPETVVYEESIRVPEAWPLHGKVVGHRRLIVNRAHDTVTGPHYAKREQISPQVKMSTSSAIAMERQLRDSLRAVCQQSESASRVEPILGEDPESDMTPSLNHGPSIPPRTESRMPVTVGTAHPQMDERPIRIMPDTPEAGVESSLEPTCFDIVLPPPPAPPSGLSPLERALRTLASEKRG